MKKLHTLCNFLNFTEQNLHTYNYKYKEEEEEMEISREEFEDFIQWLIADGLQPKKSARLWKKTIFSNLINDQRMTIANYQDFLEYKKEKEYNILKNINDKMDTLDYTILLNSKIIIDGKVRNISSYQLADSMVHLFFDDGGNFLISRKEIYRLFCCKK